MKSTGEVMGIDVPSSAPPSPRRQSAAYGGLPTKGTVFVSVANRDKRAMIFPVKRLADLGFEILATEGTAEVLRRNGVLATVVASTSQSPGRQRRPSTGSRRRHRPDLQHPVRGRTPARRLRDPHRGVTRGVPCITTIQGAAACVQGIEALVRGDIGVRSLQEHHAFLRASRAAQTTSREV